MPKQATNIIIKVKKNWGIFNKGSISSDVGSSLCPVDKMVFSDLGNIHRETRNSKNISTPIVRKGSWKPL